MRDYIKRFLIAGIMALFVSLLFLGAKQSQAEMLSTDGQTCDCSVYIEFSKHKKQG